MTKNEGSYHHGDLRAQLLEQAMELIQSGGVAALSMRKLGEQLGVSRTALYHHFKNKDDLLSAIAANGFNVWFAHSSKYFNDDSLSSEQKLLAYVTSYLKFATGNKDIYDLMFGKTLWLSDKSSEELKEVAYNNFNYHLELIKDLQKQGLLSDKEDSLRLAQVSWGALHGISRLFIDGVYVDKKHLDELSQTVVNMLKVS